MRGPDLVSFTFSANGYIFDLSSGPTHRSRESGGVWVQKNKAWKFFNMDQWARVSNDYTTATNCGLPTPSYELHKGTIIDSRKRKREGFALAAAYMTHPARFFAMKKGTVLIKQLINSITNDDTLSRIQGAFIAAKTMGLRDPQGFINRDDPNQPIVFIDLHTSNFAMSEFQKMHDCARDRRALLLQQRG